MHCMHVHGIEEQPKYNVGSLAVMYNPSGWPFRGKVNVYAYIGIGRYAYGEIGR